MVQYQEGRRYILLAGIWCAFVSSSTRLLWIDRLSYFQASGWLLSSYLSSIGAQGTSRRLHVTHHSRDLMQMSRRAKRRKRRANTLTNLSLPTPYPHTRVSRHTTTPTPRRHHLPIPTDYLLHQPIPAPPASRLPSLPPTVSLQQTQVLIAHQRTRLHLLPPPLPQRTLPQDQVWTRMARSRTLPQVDSAAYRRRSHLLRRTRRRLRLAGPCSMRTHMLLCGRRWRRVRQLRHLMSHTLGTDSEMRLWTSSISFRISPKLCPCFPC